LIAPSSIGTFRSREQLGEAAFETPAAEGRTLTLEQAIDLALQRTN
jgi:hypothetical protein